MKPETYKLLDDGYNKFPEGRAEVVPTRNDIRDAEIVLGVSFHDDYIDFLLRYGADYVGANSIYGLRPSEEMDIAWSVIEQTHFYRNDNWPYVKKWYVISDDGFGNPIGISPDGHVMSYDHDRGQLYEVAINFEIFLTELLNFKFDDD